MINKAQTFKYIFLNSLFPSVEYYPKLLKTRLAFSVKYATLLLMAVNALLYVTVILKLINPLGESGFRAQTSSLLKKIPSDMKFIIKNNRLITNYERPLIIYSSTTHSPQPLIVVDEFAPPEKIHEYKSSALFTKTGLALKNNDGFRFYRYKFSNTMILDRELASYYLDRISQLLPFFLLIGFFLIIPIATAASIVIKSIALAGMALLIFTTSRIFSAQVTYSKTFQIGLHAMTLPVFVEVIFTLLGIKMQINSLFPLITFIFVAGGVYEAYFGKSDKTRKSSK